MLEEIALSISTAIFFMCAFLVNGIVPQTPAETAVPCETVVATDEFSLVGTWNSDGRVFEFKDNGRLIYNGQIMNYSHDGDTVTVNARIGKPSEKNGAKRTYNMKLELLGDRIIKLNGVTLYRTEQP